MTVTSATQTKTKWVYSFGDGKAEGGRAMRDLLGGKGANLAEMASLGLPVPPGFTISTDVCTYFYQNDRTYPADLEGAVEAALAQVEQTVGARFGDPAKPLLVSVRSGARVSMPGMMDTVLNLGLNDETAAGLAHQSGDERFAWDSYRRFIQMYADVVMGVDHYLFEEAIEIHKEGKNADLDTDLDADDWKQLVEAFKKIVAENHDRPFPQDPKDQLWGAIGAVFGSWQIDRARTYRRLHNIPEEWGTAVNVQAMVFGNMGETSATGVAFTRNPSTGEREVYGEFLVNAQGEDVVAGIRTPQPLSREAAEAAGPGSDKPSMEEVMPGVYGQLLDVFEKLETHYRDMQDIEFTVQEGKLWMLQTRAGKRTAKAALRIAVNMAHEGLITEIEAVMRVEPSQLDQLLHPTLDPAAPRDVLTKGLPASPGAASGQVVFTADEAEEKAKQGENVILVRVETSPEDIHGMAAARGILTSRGGMTSHAAVVARGMGRCCVSGAGSLHIDIKTRTITCNGRTLKGGDLVTLDGTTGEVMVGEVPTLKPELSGDFSTLMQWADRSRKLKVRANTDTPGDTQTAREFGAEGIGLCRTEHMFFEADRIIAVRQMILAHDADGRRAALEKLRPMQRGDFVELFRIMAGLPVTIRLLDPPLHEFLPHEEQEFADVAEAMGVEPESLRWRAKELEEFNPMLGHRGCRLAVTYPEIYEMQTRAIIEAALEVAQESGQTVVPEIMIPLVFGDKELASIRKRVEAVAQEVIAASGHQLDYLIGTMIELPRACLQAGSIADHADFFSFGTNDLTQTTLGISRDDASRFLPAYVEQGLLAYDPFVSMDRAGVGELVKIAAERGRATKPEIKLGICGEHGGDPQSVAFCHRQGLDYVSCSAYRVPIARLAAAQAALAED
ncbi:pyruvate, phosphate dikinase [Rhodothalassium salexigens]|uniref:pyruvate, phosphate dikinase n=1 Tax=Rhodothalassium salexigens TaxID=1086 RepID=UPI0019132068|nr:pyruvate, phosphate dikinase [Rhodothalassium salexigens]MBK5911217.1 pyruvate, phosphate dikinase [Rhodothalassium salexigens]MBK5919906.1 pyruvate, phosphate dikinase [Rhodothalassium salexigens]